MSVTLKILIVEDSAEDAGLLASELMGAGYAVISRRVDREADYLASLDAEWDIIFSDFTMPSFSALRALELLRRSRRVIPFIVISGTIGEERAVEIVKLGATDYVLKDRLSRVAPVVERALREVRERAERQRTEEELRWRTALFEALIDSAIDGILVVDSQGRKLVQNPRMAELWKIPKAIADDVDDSRQVQFVTNLVKDPEAFAAKVTALYAQPSQVSRDEVALTNGTILDRYSAPVMGKDGQHYGRIWTFRDLTPHKELEARLRQAQKMEAIGQLAGGVAHDFNNMLVVIRVSAAMLADPDVTKDEIRDLSRQVIKAADRAAGLTRQLLLFSRKEVMKPANVDLNEIVRDLTRMLQRIVGEDIRLQGEFAPHLPYIHADAGMIEQVLMNLVVNARDAMARGGNLTISTSVEDITEVERLENPDAAPGAYVCLTVQDEGSGIAPEHMSRIFEPFFTTKEVGKGTGLGLATAYGIVKQHRGWITVSSQLNHGTTFRIYLPALEGGQSSRHETDFLTKPAVGTETILVVEDEVSLRLLVCNMFERLGYTVLSAQTGTEALEIWKNNRETIDLLFTDMVMPDGMTGRELALHLRTERPQIRVIYTSGYSPDLFGQDQHWMQDADFLQKPYITPNSGPIGPPVPGPDVTP